MFDDRERRMARRDRRGGEAGTLDGRRAAARARAGARPLALFAPIKAGGSTGWSRRRPSSESPASSRSSRGAPSSTGSTSIACAPMPIEAAEQCERTALPELAEPRKLEAILRDWPEGRLSISPTRAAASRSRPRPRPGGDPDRARRRLHRRGARLDPGLAFARPVSLGPRILRADTAALAAISLWMAAAGDW